MDAMSESSGLLDAPKARFDNTAVEELSVSGIGEVFLEI
jgi:hypothetical protein